jgi:hypothetical protein
MHWPRFLAQTKKKKTKEKLYLKTTEQMTKLLRKSFVFVFCATRMPV